MSIKKIFNESEKEKILQSIIEAEKNTSGEIRVHVDAKCKINPLKKAKQIFFQLNMNQTKLRNGILFYLAIESKDFCVYGDAGIHEKVGQDFWDKITAKSVSRFKKSEFTEGLSEAIIECGEQLKQHFPYQQNDINELDNEITFGKS